MAYSLIGQDWPDRVITWTFAEPAASDGNIPAITASFDTMQQQALAYEALQRWTEISGVSFVPVEERPGGEAADIRIGFYDNTGRGTNIGQSGQGVGVTFWSWADEHFLAGTTVLVQDPQYWRWVTTPEGDIYYSGGTFTPLQVLTHELGHALGLAHSDTTDDLMYPSVSPANVDFSADDIAGIQSLYGCAHRSEAPGEVVGPGGVTAGTLQFNAVGYLAANPDVAAAGLDAAMHFDLYGWREGRDPSADFDMRYYLAMNPDVAAAGTNPFSDYLQQGQAAGRAPAAAVVRPDANGFDAGYYDLANADVARAGVDALAHYTTHGWREGRDPNGYFHTADYLALNPDVAAARVDPLAHYMAYGAQEGRQTGPQFDSPAYLAENPDVAAAGVNPLLHFLQYGLYEGRAPETGWQV